METEETTYSPGRFLIYAAALVVVIAGMKASQTILVPFLLAVFLAVATAPMYFFLTRRRVPQWAALLMVMMAIIGASVGAGTLIGSSVKSFLKEAPTYQSQLSQISETLHLWFESHGIEIPKQDFSEYFNLGAVMGFVANMFSELGNLVTNGFLILVTMAFMLFEASSIPTKIRVVFGDSELTPATISEFTASINRYMVIKICTSLLTAVLVWFLLFMVGVNYPQLWAFMAFVLNFVPNLGSIIAAVPACLLALLQLGFMPALIVAGGYLVINAVIGNFLEPRAMGKSLGLSTLVVFLCLVFWGWVLGPVGMILSVPLTMAIKIGLQSHKDTRWIAVLLGTGSEACAQVFTNVLNRNQAREQKES